MITYPDKVHTLEWRRHEELTIFLSKHHARIAPVRAESVTEQALHRGVLAAVVRRIAREVLSRHVEDFTSMRDEHGEKVRACALNLLFEL